MAALLVYLLGGWIKIENMQEVAERRNIPVALYGSDLHSFFSISVDNQNKLYLTVVQFWKATSTPRWVFGFDNSVCLEERIR
jgi:hypothetical protein